LDYLRSIQQINWLTGIRKNSFAPVIILSDTPEKDVNGMVQLGADMCISGKWPCFMIADLAFAQLRRYTTFCIGLGIIFASGNSDRQENKKTPL